MVIMYLIFPLLPVLVYSRINIKIYVNGGKTSVKISGFETSVISDREIRSFQLNDTNLKKASEIFKGKSCKDVYLKPPTDFGDVYSKYNWDPVQRSLRPVIARTLSITNKPVTLASAENVNNHEKPEASYSATVKHSVEETVDHAWSGGEQLNVGPKINYQVNFDKGSGGGSTLLSYSSNWNEDTSQSRKVTLGTSSTVIVLIPPGGKVKTSLTANKVTSEIEVDYAATVKGDVFCSYESKYRGHYFWAYDLSGLQRAVSLPRVVTATEKLTVSFYTNVRVEITNSATSDTIETMNGGIIKIN